MIQIKNSETSHKSQQSKPNASHLGRQNLPPDETNLMQRESSSLNDFVNKKEIAKFS